MATGKGFCGDREAPATQPAARSAILSRHVRSPRGRLARRLRSSWMSSAIMHSVLNSALLSAESYDQEGSPLPWVFHIIRYTYECGWIFCENNNHVQKASLDDLLIDSMSGCSLVDVWVRWYTTSIGVVAWCLAQARALGGLRRSISLRGAAHPRQARGAAAACAHSRGGCVCVGGGTLRIDGRSAALQ